jgi:Uma2 family endonuclease
VIPVRPIGDVWTVDDLERLPHTLRAELRDGNLVIKSPARLWQGHIRTAVCSKLSSGGRAAFTEVGIQCTDRDARVADIAVFYNEPSNPDSAWQRPDTIALVVEVWSPSSHGKDHTPDWYAELGIPEYWLAEPIEGEKWGALITMYERVQAASGRTTYVETRTATLATLERDGLAQEQRAAPGLVSARWLSSRHAHQAGGSGVQEPTER